MNAMNHDPQSFHVTTIHGVLPTIIAHWLTIVIPPSNVGNSS